MANSNKDNKMTKGSIKLIIIEYLLKSEFVDLFNV